MDAVWAIKQRLLEHVYAWRLWNTPENRSTFSLLRRVYFIFTLRLASTHSCFSPNCCHVYCLSSVPPEMYGKQDKLNSALPGPTPHTPCSRVKHQFITLVIKDLPHCKLADTAIWHFFRRAHIPWNTNADLLFHFLLNGIRSEYIGFMHFPTEWWLA